MHLSTAQIDRAAGAVLASAAADALGSQYEFDSSIPDSQPVEFGVGTGGHGYGEWTDDTSMAVPVLQELAAGHDLRDEDALGRVLAAWDQWSGGSPDVGVQTKSILRGLRGQHTEAAARAASKALHDRSGRSAGNGSLMRTGPLALGYLGDGEEAALAEAAGRLAQLTHWEQDNVDACVIWCLAIRHAVLNGELDLAGQLRHLEPSRRERWAELIEEASAPGRHPRDFEAQNGWVVRAMQGAIAAFVGAESLVEILERAVRCGGDTDTVAAIAGSLAGAVHGTSEVPADWQLVLHGWPGLRAADLVRMAVLAARKGADDGQGWPSAGRMPGVVGQDFLGRHPHDEGVWLGSLSGLDRIAADAPDVDAVVSLCRIGAEQVPAGMPSVQVWMVDRDGANPNLDVALAGAVDAVAAPRAARSCCTARPGSLAPGRPPPSTPLGTAACRSSARGGSSKTRFPACSRRASSGRPSRASPRGLRRHRPRSCSRGGRSRRRGSRPECQGARRRRRSSTSTWTTRSSTSLSGSRASRR